MHRISWSGVDAAWQMQRTWQQNSERPKTPIDSTECRALVHVPVVALLVMPSQGSIRIARSAY